MKPCGTSAAYFRHIRNNETPCIPCRQAETRRRSEYPRKRGKRMQRAWTLTDEVTDWLYLDGGWLTVDAIAGRFDRHPDSVWRVLRELESDGLVERRELGLSDRETRTEWSLR